MDWKTNTSGVHQVHSRPPVPELPRVRRVPLRLERRDQEGAEGRRRRSPRCSSRCSDSVRRCGRERGEDCQDLQPEPRPRRYERGRRRVSVYIAWSYPGEANRDVTRARQPLLDHDRGPARRSGPPTRRRNGRTRSGSSRASAGSLELFFWAWVKFQDLVGEVTGHAVPVFQRVDQAGFSLPLDERVLDDADTLLVFGLDHLVTEQVAAPAEIEAVRAFLEREGTCLVIGPHHDVGPLGGLERTRHGVPAPRRRLVPRQQRFGGYTRSLMKGLGIPVENRWGLRPAVVQGGAAASSGAAGRIAPLTVMRDLDTRGWLDGVTNFNFHLHLPHYAVRRKARARSTSSRSSRSTSPGRTRSPMRATRSSTPCSGCPRPAAAPATCSSSTRRCSARCSDATRAWSASGENIAGGARSR